MTLDELKALEKHNRKLNNKKNTYAADACKELWEAHRLAIIRHTYNEDDCQEMTLSKVAKDYYRTAYTKFLAMKDSKSAEAIKLSEKLFITPYSLTKTKEILKKLDISDYEKALASIKVRSDYRFFDMDIVRNCLNTLDF